VQVQAQQILEKYTILSAAYHGDDLNGVSDCHLYQGWNLLIVEQW